jgi:hypothetical protein
MLIVGAALAAEPFPFLPMMVPPVVVFGRAC